MALSAFGDKTRPPRPDDLRSTLGTAYGAWADLIRQVSDRVPDIAELWGYTSKNTGWGLRLRHKDRVILYMTPCERHFLVSFALGETAVAAANAAKLPKALLSAIDEAPRYAEGRGVRIIVKRVTDVAALAELAKIKNEH